MPTYIGFSTLGADKPKSTNVNSGVDGGFGGILTPVNTGKKYRLVDQQLVLQDFINALNIPLGQKVGQPGYGTTLWGFVFEPNTADVQYKLETEVRRIAGLDPRLLLNSLKCYPQDNGILIELELAIAPFNQARLVSLFLDQGTNQAIIQ